MSAPQSRLARLVLSASPGILASCGHRLGAGPGKLIASCFQCGSRFERSSLCWILHPGFGDPGRTQLQSWAAPTAASPSTANTLQVMKTWKWTTTPACKEKGSIQDPQESMFHFYDDFRECKHQIVPSSHHTVPAPLHTALVRTALEVSSIVEEVSEPPHSTELKDSNLGQHSKSQSLGIEFHSFKYGFLQSHSGSVTDPATDTSNGKSRLYIEYFTLHRVLNRG